jgi:hypothetical protein
MVDPNAKLSRARQRLNALDIILIMIVVAYMVLWLGQRYPMGGC